jgi:hypothetical protein
MGLQIDLHKAFKAPLRINCPECGRDIRTIFDDYDIETGCNQRPGEWRLLVGCDNCEFASEMVFKVECQFLRYDKIA